MYDIYSNAEADKLRFTLGKEGSRKLFAIGLNPSTATREKSDTTVAKVENVARINGYDGFVMLNLYPVRATDYNTLPAVPDSNALLRNLAKIEEAVTSQPGSVVWAAWGDCVDARPYFAMAIQMLNVQLRKHGTVWKHFGSLTKQGHPRHPSRLQYAWQFSDFDIAGYLLRLSPRLSFAPTSSVRLNSRR